MMRLRDFLADSISPVSSAHRPSSRGSRQKPREDGGKRKKPRIKVMRDTLKGRIVDTRA